MNDFKNCKNYKFCTLDLKIIIASLLMECHTYSPPPFLVPQAGGREATFKLSSKTYRKRDYF